MQQIQNYTSIVILSIAKNPAFSNLPAGLMDIGW